MSEASVGSAGSGIARLVRSNRNRVLGENATLLHGHVALLVFGGNPDGTIRRDAFPARLRREYSMRELRAAYGEAYLRVWHSISAGRIGPPPHVPPKRWESLDEQAQIRYLRKSIRLEAERILRRHVEGSSTSPKDLETFDFIKSRPRPQGVPLAEWRLVQLREWNLEHRGDPHRSVWAMLSASRRGRDARAVGAFAAGSEEASVQGARAIEDQQVAQDELASLVARAQLTDRQRELFDVIRGAEPAVMRRYSSRERDLLVKKLKAAVVHEM